MSTKTTISLEELQKRLNPHFLKLVKLEQEMEVIDIRPTDILNARRFDIPAKYIYAKFRDMDISSSWGEEIYTEHIRAFSNFHEGDGSGKSSREAYIKCYNAVLDSIQKGGFDSNISILPLGHDNEALDGSHRSAASLYYGREMKAIRVPDVSANYNYNLFIDRGLDLKYCDAIAYEYCKLKANTYIVVVFPAAEGQNYEVEHILNKFGKVFYKKEVCLNKRGARNLIINLYKDEKWLGGRENCFQGAEAKVAPCFTMDNPLRVYVFECDDISSVISAKEEIRRLFDIGNNSVHINDSHDETIMLAQILLNENSIHLLNNMDPMLGDKLHGLLEQYKGWLNSIGADKECFCIDTSAVMSVYGMREPGDLDYLHYGYEDEKCGADLINSHNEEMRYHIKSKDDIIFNPQNHFYYDGLKFASLEVIRLMKANRGEGKDIEDLKLMEPYLASTERNSSTSRFEWQQIKANHVTENKKQKVYRWIYKRVEPFLPYTRTINYLGYKVYYSKGTSIINRIMDTGFYEKDICERIVQELSKKQDPVMLDIGANIGLVSIYALASISNVKIHAFEPGDHQSGFLDKTIVGNGLSDKITLNKFALSYRSGMERFAIQQSQDASGDIFFDTGTAGEAKYIDVPVRTADEWWFENNCPRIDFIKMDTEGSELWILKGAEKLISENKPVILFELQPEFTRLYSYECSDVLEWLNENGYCLYTLDRRKVNNKNAYRNFGVQTNFIAYPKAT